MTMVTSGAGRHVLITGGAGYIGSVITGKLLRRGDHVTVVDNLLFGGESVLAYLPDPHFHFMRADVCQPGVLKQAVSASEKAGAPPPSAVVHLAAIVGFPACQSLGREAVWHINVDAVRRVLDDAETLGVEKMVYTSTYSVYGIAPDGKPVTEDTPLNPQSLYAESKIAAEALLLDAVRGARCAPLIMRIATLFGGSPRMRFDLIVNQFVLEAYTHGELLIYQGHYARSFVHIRDVVDGLVYGLDAPAEKVRGQIYNLGSREGNYTKEEIVALTLEVLPETIVRREVLSFAGDMRDIRVSFDRIERELGFCAQRSVAQGIDEVLHLLRSGLISDPNCERYRNSPPIVQ